MGTVSELFDGFSNLALTPESAPEPGIRRRRSAWLNSDSITSRSGKFVLNLFEDAIYSVVVERTEPVGSSLVRFCRLEGKPQGRLIVAEQNGVIAASLLLPGENWFAIRYLGNGLHEITELQSGAAKPATTHCVVDLQDGGKAKESAIQPEKSVAGAGPENLESPIIDTMIIYTPATTAAHGGPDGVSALIALAVAEVNEVFTNSLINAQLRLVHQQEVQFAESGDANLQTDYNRLANYWEFRCVRPAPNHFCFQQSGRLIYSQPVLPTQDLRVKETARLLTPRALKAELPMTERSNETVVTGRDLITRILARQDPRFLVVVGPCSIHDPTGALEYASKLNALRHELGDQFCLVMRVYFEKPRTTIGWKGLINDPHLDGTYDIETGLKQARRLLLEITGMGLPTATEFLDPITPQYIADLVSWAAIGARTTESQTHREMASGLSMPVGFKNGTDGGLQIAVDAMCASRTPHNFLGIDQDGVTSIIRTTGNPIGHVVLRGGRLRTNYDAESLREAEAQLAQVGLPAVLMVDCSHANSGKQHARQEDVWHNLIEQRLAGNRALIGTMIESYLSEGTQPIPKNLGELHYGVSVTDACLGWEVTERMLRQGHAALAKSACDA